MNNKGLLSCDTFAILFSFVVNVIYCLISGVFGSLSMAFVYQHGFSCVR